MVNILHTDLRSKSNLHTLYKHNCTVDHQLADIIIFHSLTPSRSIAHQQMLENVPDFGGTILIHVSRSLPRQRAAC